MIYIRITIDGIRTEFSLQRKCEAIKWNKEKGRLKSKGDEAKSFNNYLDSVQFTIYEIFQELLTSRTEFDGDLIKAKFLGEDDQAARMFLEIYEQHNV